MQHHSKTRMLATSLRQIDTGHPSVDREWLACNDPHVKRGILKEFQQIHGVGKSIAEDFWGLGYRSLEELRGEDPQQMYERLGGPALDRCVLYVCRTAVYYASVPPPLRDPDLSRWWDWKEQNECLPKPSSDMMKPGFLKIL